MNILIIMTLFRCQWDLALLLILTVRVSGPVGGLSAMRSITKMSRNFGHDRSRIFEDEIFDVHENKFSMWRFRQIPPNPLAGIKTMLKLLWPLLYLTREVWVYFNLEQHILFWPTYFSCSTYFVLLNSNLRRANPMEGIMRHKKKKKKK